MKPFAVYRKRYSESTLRLEGTFETSAEAGKEAREYEDICRRDHIIVKDLSKDGMIIGRYGAAKKKLRL